MKGGYCLVDCAGLDLSTLGTVPGLYKQIKSAVEANKPIVLCGVVNDEQAFTPMVAYGGTESASSVFVSFFPVTLHISSSDVVTM